MLTGMVSAENLSHVLRSVAQKRQHGVMELNFADRTVQLVFVGGKIADLLDSSSPTLSELLCWLIEGGIVDSSFQPGESRNYSELFVAINERPNAEVVVTEDLFKRVVKQRLLDRLYRLDFSQPALYTFRAQMAEHDKDFSPLVSVSQFLLDKVAYETDSERFEKLFHQNSIVMRLESAPDVLSEEEGIIYELLAQPIPLDLLRKQSMLSCYQFQNALLALFDRAAIEVDAESPPVESGDHVAGALTDDLVGALEFSTERPYIDTENFKVSPEAAITPPAPPTQQENEIEDITEEVQPLGSLKKTSPSREMQQDVEEIRVSRFFIWNIKLLQSNALPNLLTVLFLAAAVSIIYTRWVEVVSRF